MSFLYLWENKQRKMTEMLRNITNSKECQNLADSRGLCLETHLKTYYNKAQLWRKRIRETGGTAMASTVITKDMTIGELLQINEGLAPVLVAGGMHCIGCPSSQMETVEEAAQVHGIETELLLARLNAFLEALESC